MSDKAILKALHLNDQTSHLPMMSPPAELEARMHNFSFKSRHDPNANEASSGSHMAPRFRLAQSPVNAGTIIGRPTEVKRRLLASTSVRALDTHQNLNSTHGGMTRSQSAATLGGGKRLPPATIGVPHRVEVPAYTNLPPRKRDHLGLLAGLKGELAPHTDDKTAEGGPATDENSGSESSLFKRKALLAIQDCAYRANACRRAGRVKAEANAYISMGIHYDNIAEYVKAARCYMQSIQTLEGAVQDMLVTTLAYNCVAISLFQAGPRYWEQAIHYNQLHLDHTSAEGKFSAFTNLGLIFTEMNEPQRASDCHKDALRCALKLKSVPKQAIAIGNLGLSGYRHQDYVTAEACMERHLQLSKTLGDLRGQGLATQMLGEIASRKQNFGKATNYFQSSMQLSKQSQDNRACDGAKVQLGVALAQARMEAHMKTAARTFEPF